MKKNNTTFASLIAIICLLAIIAVISIVYNFFGGIYYSRIAEYNNVLGEDLTISVLGDGAFVSTCNFSGSLVIDGNTKQRVGVGIGQIKGPLFLRAKFGVGGIEGFDGVMLGAINWVMSSDGYLYYNKSANSLDKINLCTEVRLNLQMKLKSSKNYVMYFVVEASENGWEYEAI